MSQHTLRALISESDETVKHTLVAREWSESILSAALSHPKNAKITREWEFSLRSRYNANPPARVECIKRYRELAQRLSLTLPENVLSRTEFFIGFPQYTFTHGDSYGLSVPETLTVCSRAAVKCGFSSERGDRPNAIFITFWEGEIWLPVLSHPRGNETHIDWTGHSLTSLPDAFRIALIALRSESKDIPLCKSLECYSVSMTARALALPSKIILTTEGAAVVTGSTLKRIPTEYL